MKEIFGDLFAAGADAIAITTNGVVSWREAIAITTNGVVSWRGANVMGRGCAGEAKRRWPGIEFVLGQLIRERGNYVHKLTRTESKLPLRILLSSRVCAGWPHESEIVYSVPCHLFSFPTRHHWKDGADLGLIQKSATALIAEMDRAGLDSVVVPRPGCGLRSLSWEEQVRPILTKLWDDRFSVIHPGGMTQDDHS